MIFGTPSIVTNGLILHLDAGNRRSYPGSGTTWTDLSGNNRNFNLQNGPIFNNANQGFISFDGTNDFASGSAITGLGSSDRTVNIWVKQDTLLGGSFRRVFTLSADNGATDEPAYTFSWDTGGTGGSGIGWGGSPYDGSLGFSLTTGSWWNVCATITSTKTGLGYQNGRLVSSKTGTGPVGANPIPQIARYNAAYGQYGNPNIALIQIYNRVLSPQEVAQNYNALKNRFGLR